MPYIHDGECGCAPRRSLKFFVIPHMRLWSCFREAVCIKILYETCRSSGSGDGAWQKARLKSYISWVARLRVRLLCKSSAPFATAAKKNPLSGSCFKTLPVSVRPNPLPFLWLVCTFHHLCIIRVIGLNSNAISSIFRPSRVLASRVVCICSFQFPASSLQPPELSPHCTHVYKH